MNANIKLNKNAPRDGAGRLQGEFSQHNHHAKRLAREAGGTVGYLLYSFMLDSAGGEFNFTITNFIAMFSDMKFSKSQVGRALKALENVGLLSKALSGYQGKQPQYLYEVNEISTKLQTTAIDTKNFDGDFSAAEIETAIDATQKFNVGHQYTDRISVICQNDGLTERKAQEKIVECCAQYQRDNGRYPQFPLISKFINIIREDYAMSVTEIYQKATA